MMGVGLQSEAVSCGATDERRQIYSPWRITSADAVEQAGVANVANVAEIYKIEANLSAQKQILCFCKGHSQYAIRDGRRWEGGSRG